MQWSKEYKGLTAQGLVHVSITKGEVASVQPQEATPFLGTWALMVGLYPSTGKGGRWGPGVGGVGPDEGPCSFPTCPSEPHLFLHALREQHHDAGLDGQGDVPAQLSEVGSQRHPIHPGEGGGRHRGGGVCRDEIDQRPRVLPPLSSQVRGLPPPS